MADRIPKRARSARVMAELIQQASAERYLQHQVWRDGADARDRPRPLEFDTDGFPIAQRRPGFVNRVGRLIDGI
jgi:hypothetical protein